MKILKALMYGEELICFGLRASFIKVKVLVGVEQYLLWLFIYKIANYIRCGIKRDK